MLYTALINQDMFLAGSFVLLPSSLTVIGTLLFLSHIIASMTLSIPGMILSETALSFLGLGLREPAISWGVLLKRAQNVAAVAVSPWELWAPAAAVVIVVLAFNFMGDGMRDAADPYAR